MIITSIVLSLYQVYLLHSSKNLCILIHMRDIFNAIKVAALFIGTVIGAGFATGRELCLYFANSEIFTLIFSAALMGFFCFIFLFLGSKNIKSPITIGKIINIVTVISAFFVYSAMLAASEELIRSSFGIPLAGIFIGFLSAVCSNSLSSLKKVNIILIPILIVIVIFIAILTPNWSLTGSFRPINALGYCTMNMLFVSKLMYESGSNMRTKHIIISCVAVSIAVFILMYLLLKPIIIYKTFSMPFLMLCNANNCGIIAIVVILAAIFTTVTSCNKIVAEQLTYCVNKKYLSLIIILVSGITLSFAGFMKIVNITYPIISAFGIAVCAFSIFQYGKFIHNQKHLRYKLPIQFIN